MTAKYVICPDVDELGSLDPATIYFANSEEQAWARIHELANIRPNNTLCAYRLDFMQKIKTKPTYAKYKMNDSGEVLPV